jgi:hypothetical protein
MNSSLLYNTSRIPSVPTNWARGRESASCFVRLCVQGRTKRGQEQGTETYTWTFSKQTAGVRGKLHIDELA